MSKANSFLTYENHKLVLGPHKKSLEPCLRNYESPVYVYDLDFVADRCRKYQRALPGAEIYYAMKANSHLQILKALKVLGCGMDVVSGGEIARAQEAGFAPSEMIYSGVGKTVKELRWAISHQIRQINVESVPELERLSQLTQEMKQSVAVALRLNPDVDIKTHPYIATGLRDNKFGMTLDQLPHLQAILQKNPRLQLKGLSVHLGSQMHHLEGFRDALKSLRPVYENLQKQFPQVEVFDIGGGLGIFYDRQDLAAEEQTLEEYGRILREELGGLKARFQTEPGRWVVAHAGVLLTQVQYVKPTQFKNFVVVDTGMHHLLRPALYQAYHAVLPYVEKTAPVVTYDVVGPICESSDVLAMQRSFPEVSSGDFLVIADAGAYGYSMRSDYNLQPAPLEICI